jgi:glycogen operon protein
MTIQKFGKSYPLGATIFDGGVNFSIYSKNAKRLELLLFDDIDDKKPSRIIELDPAANRTYYYWHIFVGGIGEGQLYGFRAHGPFTPEKGLRFDGTKLLLDPYARAVAVGKLYDREAAKVQGDNCQQAMKGVVVDPRNYDWEGDIPLEIDYSISVIYEMHAAGFTKHPNSGVSPNKSGTYAGLVEKISYLKDLGITAVELLPIQQYDEQDTPTVLSNYWGYSPIGLFAPHCGYSSDKNPLGTVNEFREMVKAFHRAGIEVILDVVFNHTAEGDHDGPILSFKGLENEAYYILQQNKALYANYSGTGNTINANYSIVRRLILDCLRYWVNEMHVDGFRFDLASVLSRGEQGEPLDNPPILWAIESSPELAGTKIIAEAWDAAGLYQVGSFIGDRWAEWNGRFRDDTRRFLKNDDNSAKNIACRLVGSPDIYSDPEREPSRSINFVTCHDGFTLNDLVSYNRKHNKANLENNKDGASENFSWNCGVEGTTNDPDIEKLRLKQIKNYLTFLFVSQGTPMLLMGDEVRRTQSGNNNAYCQDNDLSWFDWDLVQKNAGLLRFTRLLIRFTQSRPIFSEERFLRLSLDKEHPYVIWHGVQLNQPDWRPSSHTMACTLVHPKHNEKMHLLFNAYWKDLTFQLPKTIKKWRRIIDTSFSSPDDIYESEVAEMVRKRSYTLPARSAAMLFLKENN